MTAMQEFADKLKKMAITREQEGSACAGVWNTIHHWATQMVDKEKEQILNYISFGAELKKSMEEKVYEDIKNNLQELVKQGKLKDYRNYKHKDNETDSIQRD